MALFKDLLKKWFYQNSSSAASSDARVPLLTATGDPKGSDTMANISSVLGGWKIVDFRNIQDATEKDLDRVGENMPQGYGFRLGWANASNTSLLTNTVGYCIDFNMGAQIIFSYNSSVHVFRYRNGTIWITREI